MRNTSILAVLVLAGCQAPFYAPPPPDGSAPLPVAVPVDATNLALAADGRRAAYERVGAPGRLYLAAAGEAAPAVVELGPQTIQALRWSPAGDALFVAARPTGASDIVPPSLLRIPAAGGAPVAVAWLADAGDFDVAPAGDAVAVLPPDSGVGTANAVAIVAPATGTRREVFAGPMVQRAAFAPDGRSLLVTAWTGGRLGPAYLRVVPVDGGAAGAIPIVPGGYAAWLPDGDVVVSEPGGYDAPARIRVVSIAGETRRVVEIPGGEPITLYRPGDLSPDGTQVLIAGSTPERSEDRAALDLRDGRLTWSPAKGLRGWLADGRVFGLFTDGLRALPGVQAFPRGDAPTGPAPVPHPSPTGAFVLAGDWRFALPGLAAPVDRGATYLRYRIAEPGGGQPIAVAVSEAAAGDPPRTRGLLKGGPAGDGYAFEGESRENGNPFHEALRLRPDPATGRLVGDRRIGDGEWLPVELAPEPGS